MTPLSAYLMERIFPINETNYSPVDDWLFQNRQSYLHTTMLRELYTRIEWYRLATERIWFLSLGEDTDYERKYLSVEDMIYTHFNEYSGSITNSAPYQFSDQINRELEITRLVS